MYSSLTIYEETYIIARNELGEGVLDVSGAEIIPLNFKSIKYLSNDLFIVESETGFGIMHKKELIAPLEFDSVQLFSKEFLLLIKSNQWSYLDMATGKLIEMKPVTGE